MKIQNNSSNSNLSLIFYKNYFKGIDFNNIESESNQRIIMKNNERIINETGYINILNDIVSTPQKFEAKITYPGLATGIGLVHEIGVEGEFKLGIHLDYTSGMPVIHGSSVKGLIRSVFPSKEKKASIKDAKRKNINGWLTDLGVKPVVSIDDLENQIFEGIVSGNHISVYDRDIFFDAVLSKPDYKGRVVVSDFITHHPDLLKAPNPVCFLKIAPGCKMCFRFDLKPFKRDGNILVTANQKLELFKKIIGYFGVGAKTNVGYGQLRMT